MTATSPDPTAVSLSPRVDTERPLSRTQSLIWASQRLAPSTPLANMGKIHRIAGRLDPELLRRAFEHVVASSDALRTVVVEPPGKPAAARVLARPPADTMALDLPLDRLHAWCADRIASPIDATAAGYDSVVIRHGDDDHTWWLDLHHVVTDAFASALVFERTAATYTALAADEEMPAFDDVGFYDHVAAQVDRADDDRRHQRAAFWSERPVDDRPIAPYGPSGPRTSVTDRLPLVLHGDLDAALEGPYRTISRELSLLTVAAMTTAATIRRLDGRAAVTLGIPIHHRSGPVASQVIGPLMELYPLHVEVADDDTFAALFDRVYRSIVSVLRNARIGESPDARFDAVVNVLTARFGDFAGLATETRWARSGHVDPSHPLRVQVYDYGDGLQLELDVNTSLSADGSQSRLPEHLGAAIDAAAADPDASVADAVGLLDDELALLASLNPPAPDGPMLRPVHEVVAERLAIERDVVTAEHDGQTLTGGQLHDRAAAIAAHLLDTGAEHGSLIGLRMRRSLDVLVAIHGVLRAGCAFVMLDPDDPPTRHEAIAADAGLERIVDSLPAIDPNVSIDRAVVPVDLDELAYVLYTSGSTGTPKGVPISHRGLADYLRFAEQNYSPGRPAVMPLHSSLVFDLTITSLFLPQLTGGRTVVLDGDPLTTLAGVAARRDLTVLKATPSQLELLARMIDEPRSLPLDAVIVGGEAFRRPVAAAFAERCTPGLRTYNEYGPTEAVVGCMIHEWDPERDTGPDVPIGTASPGAAVHVLDAAGRQTPVGAWGELYVRRDGMATGYLNLPELSAERFAPMPAVGGGPLYRTGDRVRVERGVLVYGGRDDDQLKVNGVRLEPGEIEAALVQHPAVTNAAVRVWTPGEATIQRCVRCGLGTDVPGVAIDHEGVCSVCRQYDTVEPQTRSWFRDGDDLDQIRTDAAQRSRGDFDCLHLLSGGKDSTYALYQLVERGWRVHALTLDNGFISDGAKANIARSIDDLGISHEFVTTEAMNEIFRDSLDRFANVCNGCYKTIYTLATARAHELGIPVIVTGLSRGQFFETRLVPHQFEAGRFDPDDIDRTVLQARRAYHRTTDAVTESLPEQRVFERDDLAVLDEIAYVDFYRYVDVELAEMYDFLESRAPWVRPDDTGRSTNCLVNVAGIHVHRTERGYHNYAEPYSWDVRLGHKTRDEALDELDDEIDLDEVQRMLDEIGYRPKSPDLLTAWYQTSGDAPLEPAVLRAHLRDLLPARSIPAAFVHVDDLPLAGSAKLDVAALPPPSRVQTGSADYVEPTTPTEAIAADVWARVLEVDRVGLDDDFFDLGGSSLPALEAIAAMEAEVGVDLPDALVFGHRVLRDFAEAVDRCVDGGSSIESVPALAGDARPLSPGEAAMLFEYRSDPSDTRYNVTRLYTVDDRLGIDAVRAAIETVVMRHQPLHTALDPERTVLPADRACSVSAVPSGSVDEFADRQRRVPFDLDRGPLVRVHVGHEDGATQLLIGMHHLSVDAGTFDAFWDEVDAAYHGRELPALPTTVAAHGAWQRVRWDAARAFWAHAADRSDRAGDAVPPAPIALEADGYVELESSLGARELADGSATTPFAASLAAAAVVLAAHSRTGAVELGITASTKDHPDVDPLVGYFLNTLPTLIEVDPAEPLRNVDRDAGETVAAALPHRALPLAEIVERARREGRTGPDVSHMLAYERLAPAGWGDGTARHRILASGTSVSDLTFFVQERGDELRLGLEYRGTVIGRDDAMRLLGAFDATLSAIALRSHRPAGELMATLAGADLDGPALPSEHPSLPHRIAAHAAASPESTAVIGPGGEMVTYADLWARAGEVAARVDAAAGRPRRVGVAVARSADMVTAIVAAMSAGAAYVALDPTIPDQRLDRIVEQAELDAVIVDATTRGRYPHLTEIDVAGDPNAAVHEPLHRLPDQTDVAYVVFTSGSTGVPAGVAVTHANLAASTAARPVFYGDAAPARFLLTSSIGFDSSIVGLFWPLAAGGTVVVPSDEVIHDVDRLADLVAAESVSHVLMVPSLYRAMLERRASKLTSLRCAIVAGEASTPSLVAAHHRLLPQVALVNEYGPTEATVWATAHRCDHDDPVPIGAPIPGATIRIAADDQRPVAHGAPGELLVAGPGVTGGYLGGRSNDAFVDVDGRRWYRTGDLVRDDGSGTLLFLGRADDQLNVGGVRVEPGELESLLTDIEGVAEAVVVAADVGGRDSLVAHLEGDVERLDPATIRTRLAEHVLAGAIPRVVQIHSALPRTPHGKLDRRAAAALTEAPDAVPARRTPTASQLGDLDAIVEIWRTALRSPDLDADGDFFAHGGDSLAAVEVVTGLAELAGRDVPVAALLESPTPAAMASALDLGEADPSVGVRIITMRPGHPDGPLVVLTAAWDDIQGYRALADQLPDDVTAIAPAVVRLDGSFDTVDIVVDDILSQLDDEQRTRRPIAVVGWSIGGVVAFELGQRLSADGVDVATIAMVDTYFPGEQRHLWANRWSKYKSMLNPESIRDAASELGKSARNRSRRLATRVGRKMLAWAGEDVATPTAERATPGGIPFAAMDHTPTVGRVPVTLYAAVTTNPERTVIPWRSVAPDLRVVELEGRHRGADSVMSEERVHHIVDDLLTQIDRSTD